MTSLRLRIPAAFLLGVGLAAPAFVISTPIGVAVLIASTTVIAVMAARSLVHPLESITDAARSIAQGDFGARPSVRQPGEIGNLVQAFDTMAQELQLRMAAAAQERSRLAAALNSSVDAVVAVDEDGRVLFTNVSAERLFELSSSAVVGKPIAWLLPDDSIVSAVRASRDRRLPSQSLIERPGRRFFQAVTSPIIGGGEWAVLIVLHDVTDVTRTERIRRDFVANVSHELRSPLAGIKSVIETLVGGALDERQVALDFLDRADSEVDRLIQLVEELLELSRIESGELPLVPTQTDLADMLGQMTNRVQQQAQRKNIALTADVADDLGSISLDRGRIERALLNLVHNAIKFTAEGGSIAVVANRENKFLRIDVVDSGIGIAEPHQARIFERFYKADPSHANDGGSGIGLAIVKHTVEAHGGTVTVESELGHGSRFVMRIPVAND